jgi:hypothetical protein
MYVIKNSSRLSDMSEDESLKVIKEEFDKTYVNITADIMHGKIPTIDQLKNAGVEATRNSIKRICVKGAVDETTKYVPYLIGGGVALALFMIFK